LAANRHRRDRFPGAKAPRNNWRNAGGTFVGLILASAMLLSGAPAEKHLSVYSIAANYSVPIVQREGRDYVGLLEVLEPLGRVSGKAEIGRAHV